MNDSEVVTSSVRPWPCAHCKFMTEDIPAKMQKNYVGCRWWLDVNCCPPINVHDIPVRRMGYLTRKQVYGPHDGELIVCNAFEPRGVSNA